MDELDASDEFMLALSRSSKLKSLVLHFASNIETPLLARDDPEVRAEGGWDNRVTDLWHDRPFSYFPAFKNLTRLTLLNMFGELGYWSSWILKLFIQNPTLEHLSFSIGCFTKWAIRDDDEGLYNGALPYHTFFSDLCRKYARKTSVKLALRSLRLDQPIEYPKLSTLSKLTDTTYLEDIHIATESVPAFIRSLRV